MKFNMTGKEVSSEFQVCAETVRRWARRNRVPAVKVGKGYRFNRESIISSFGNKFAQSL